MARNQRSNIKEAQSRKTTSEQGTVYRHRNEDVFVPDGYLAVGRITAAHSLRGEIRVEPHTDFPERFEIGNILYVGSDLFEAEIEQVRPHKHMMLFKLAGINNRNEAESLRGQWLFVAEEDAIALEEDTYWVHEIIGMSVQTEEGQVLGTITDVLYTGANDVYVLQPDNPEIGTGELLLPAIADVIQHVDPKAQRMIVRLLPGLI